MANIPGLVIGQASNLETAANVLIVNATPISVVFVDTDGNTFAIDETGGLVATLSEHHAIHEGITYHYSYKSPDASPIADNGTIILGLYVGAKTAHLEFDASGGGDFEGDFYEGATLTGGTNVTPQNKNRNRSNENTLSIKLNPTVSAAGTFLEAGFIPGGTGPQAAGGVGTGRTEWELKPSTVYFVRITNRAGTAQPMGIRVEWYEED